MKTEREKSIEKDLHPNVTVVITEAWDLGWFLLYVIRKRKFITKRIFKIMKYELGIKCNLWSLIQVEKASP
jgi:hypothetical protein